MVDMIEQVSLLWTIPKEAFEPLIRRRTRTTLNYSCLKSFGKGRSREESIEDAHPLLFSTIFASS